MPKAAFKVDMPSDSEIDRMFNGKAQLEQHKVLDAATRAGGNVVVKRARSLAPRSNQSARDARGKKQKAESANWDYPLWKTIKQVIRRYSHNALSVIGTEWPKGNKAYFNTSPKGRRVVYWGHRTGKVAAQVRNWIVQAFDETKPQQDQAMRKTIKKKMADIWEKRR